MENAKEAVEEKPHLQSILVKKQNILGSDIVVNVTKMKVRE